MSAEEREATIVEAAEAYIAALDEFEAFENDFPNDSTRRWEAVFDAKCAAEIALRKAVGK